MRKAALAAIGIALGIFLPAASLPAQSITVAVDGIVREVPVVERQGRRFVALETVARLFGGQVVESGAERAVLAIDDSRLVVRRRLPYIERDGRWYQMVDAAQRDAAGFYLPASSLSQLFPVLWPGRFPDVPEPGVARPPPAGGLADPAGSDLATIDVWAGPERTRLGFRLAETPGVTVDDGEPGTIRLELAGVTLPAPAAEALRGIGLVDSARVAPAPEGSSLTLWLDPLASVYAISPLSRPAGLEIVLRSGAADEAAILLAADVGLGRGPAVAARGMEGRGEIVAVSDRPPTEVPPAEDPPPADPPSSTPPPERVLRSAPIRGDWTIVLDAGHGGHDPGAIGPGGTREKAVTLAVTRALKDRLEAETGVRVILTRDGDEFIALSDRTKIANRAGADLFVSIHANSASRSAEGFETYFLSAARTEDAKRVARMENAAIRYESEAIDPGSLDELNFILLDLAQNEYLRESSALAETIQEELNRRLPLKSRGVKQAGFFVLNGAFMPAILFEMAFISNPREESLLNDPAFQTRLVEGLADSMLVYLDQYGRKVVATRAAR